MNEIAEFLSKKKKAHERLIAHHAAKGREPTWKVRLRVRLASKLETDEKVVKAKFQGRRLILTGRDRSKPIGNSQWVVFSANRFATIERAVEFGLALQAALSVAGVLTGLPIDVGADNQATGSFSEFIKERFAKDGQFLIDDVHGLDVYPDTVTAFTMFGEATLSTTTSPDSWLSPISALSGAVAKLDDQARSASLLINAASMAGHPVAVIALCVAAVELLAAGERWNEAQSAWLATLPQHVANSPGLTDDEKRELRHAVTSLNFGPSEKNRRLIRRLGLNDITRRWNKLYGKRSHLFHGVRRFPHSDLVNTASEASELSKMIVVAYIEKQTGKVLSDCRE